MKLAGVLHSIECTCDTRHTEPEGTLLHRTRLLLFSLLFAANGSAQQTPQAVPSLTLNSRLVVLDVVVTDAKGKPVQNLTAADFKVLEDGRPQRIRSVETPDVHVLPAATAAGNAANETFDPTKPANFGSSPVNILVFDQLNTHFADSSFARRSLQDFVKQQPAALLQPTTLLEVHDDHFQQLAGFTRSREALLHALVESKTQYAWKLEVNGKTDHGPLDRLQQSLEALEQMAQSFARIPGRKNVIWVGAGFPTVDPVQLATADAREIRTTLRHITNLLLETHVTLYAVDPTSSAPGMTEITDASQMAFVQAAGDTATGDLDPFSATDDFDKLAPATGGRVVRGMNDVAHQINSAVESGSTFYTVAYSPDSASSTKAAFRKISVICLRPGLTAVTRTGYYTGKDEELSRVSAAEYDLDSAVTSPLPLNAIALTVERLTPPEAPASSFRVRVHSADLTWETDAEGRLSASISLLAGSLNAKGQMVDHILQSMSANARPGTDVREPQRTADFLIVVPAEPKAVRIRFVVRDATSGHMGTGELPELHK